MIYIELYILSIVLKKGLEHTCKRDLVLVVAAFLLLFTVLPYSIGEFTRINEYGYSSLIWFILVYLCGALIKMNTPILSEKRKVAIILLALTSAVYIILRIISLTVQNDGVWGILVRILSSIDINAPLVVIISCLLLIVFSNISVKPNKLIYLFGTATFGIYLIHESPWIGPFIWYKICRTTEFASKSWFFPYSVLCVVSVFVVCGIIEILRHFLTLKIFVKKDC